MKLFDRENTISIIGAGKTGSALAFGLHSAGYNIGYIIDHKKNRAVKIAHLVKAKNSLTSVSEDCVRNSRLIIISVKDDVLPKAIGDISRFSNISEKTLLSHTSGVHSSDALAASGFCINNLASFHPVQTFKDISYSEKSLLRDIYFGIDGGITARKYLKSICCKLNSDYITIDKKIKPLYHIACVIASNFLVANFGFIAILSKAMKVSEKKVISSLIPLAESTLGNIKASGPAKALTGPVVRNDTDTISKHLRAIQKKYPGFESHYTAITAHLARMAETSKRITPDEKKVIMKILKRL